MDKQIFAALDIADHEVRLLVGEFFNTRFNIIKVERVPVAGVQFHQLSEPNEVVKAIRRAAENASRMIGARIERVLLSIPSRDMMRKSLKITVPVSSFDRRVTVLDVREAVKNAMKTKIENGLALISAVCVRYTCNGISTRRMPIGELCDELTVDVDLLCANRKIAFEYVNCVEQAGLEVLDISLDSFAIAKEAALFEQTMDQNLILIRLEEQTTTLSLLSKGKLASGEIIEQGIDQWSQALVERYELPLAEAVRLVKYNTRLNQRRPLQTPIYIWSKNTKTYTLSEKELCEAIREPLESWMSEIEQMCRPILKAGRTQVVIVGEGGELQEIAEYVQDHLNAPTKVYYPETLGVRDSALTACLGLFYAYKDQQPLLNTDQVGVNAAQFEKAVTIGGLKKEKTSVDDSITKRLKDMLFEAKQK